MSFLRTRSQVSKEEAMRKLATAPMDLPHKMKRLYPKFYSLSFFMIAPEVNKILLRSLNSLRPYVVVAP